MAEARRLVRRVRWAALPLIGVLISPTVGSARIQDYQIVRLLTYTTDCDVDQLLPVPAPGKGRHYKASCRNLTFYPDGIEVACDDPENEQSCIVVTQPRRFDNLHALRPKD